MRARRLLLWAGLTLPACVPDKPGGTDTPDDSTLGDTGETSGETAGPTACSLQVTITVGADPVPGTEVPLSVTVPAAHPDVAIDWSVEQGTLNDASAADVVWTLPGDVAEDVAATFTVTATESGGADDCIAESASVDVPVDWPERLRVVVLYNPNVSDSSAVAEHYAAARDIPTERLCGIPSADPTDLAGVDFEGWITAAQACVDAAGPQVQYIVPVYGVPYRVADLVDDIGYPDQKAVVSLDALLAYGIDALGETSAIYNPVYQAGDSLNGIYAPYVPFGDIRRSLRSYDHLYLVARIDGESAAAAEALVDRTMAAVVLAESGTLAGNVYTDGNLGDTPPATDAFGSYESGEWNIVGTRRVFEADGRYPVTWDGNAAEYGSDPAPLTCPEALYYAGWYSYYNYNDVFTWQTGAIGGHLDSCSACDIRTGTTWSAMALKRGITATFGAVSEPYVAGMPEYDQFFLYLLQGASFGEAAYESTVIGRWMMVWVGDPLYRPYP